MKHFLLSIVILGAYFSAFSANIVIQENTFYLENEKMKVSFVFESGSLKFTSLYNKGKSIEYLNADDPNVLFDLKTSIGNFNSLDGSWSLSSSETSDITFNDKIFGKKLELVLNNANQNFSVKTVFELYGEEGGLRYYCHLKNESPENILITQSDILNLVLPDSEKRLHYVSSSNLWSETSDKIENAKMNCIAHYADHGWSISLENNFATSLEEGGFKGDETQPFLFLNVFNGDHKMKVSTNPVAIQLNLLPYEEVEYFSVNITLFSGDVIDAKMAIQEHLRERFRFVDLNHVIAINDWEWYSDGSRSDLNYRNKYVPIAKRMEIDEIHIDDYWNCPISSQSSATSRNSVIPEASFTSDLVSLSEFIRNNGLELGLWYSLTGGWWGVGKDLADPAVQEEKINTIENVLIGQYHSTWQQIDLGEFFFTPQNTSYSSISDNVYRKVLGAMNILNTIAERHPKYMLQMTPEADNNRARQGIGLMELPLNGIYGAYDRLDYNYSIQQIFQNFGILPFEGMMVFQYLNTFDASNSQLYSFLTGRHTSIYDKPDFFTDEMIERTSVFNRWRKNNRITSLLNEVLRPVYFNVNDSNNGPYSWMFVNSDKSLGLLFAVAGANKTVDDLLLNIRWLDEQKEYHIFDISMDDLTFDYKYMGAYTGQQLRENGFTAHLNESQGRGKAFWITEAGNNPIEILYVDHFADNYSSTFENGQLTVSVSGTPGELVKVFAYKALKNGMECKTVRIGDEGVGETVFDTETVSAPAIRLKVLETATNSILLGLSGEISDYDHIYLERMDGYSGTWNEICDINGDEYLDEELNAAETYQYRLKYEKGNNISYSETLITQTKGSSYWRQTLFDSFEDGYYDGWKIISGSWSVINENDNKVLAQSANSDNWIYKPIESQDDYVLQVRVRLDGGSNVGISARMDENGDRYQFDFESVSQTIRLFRRNNTGALISKPVEVVPGQWYTMSLKVDGDNIEGSLNGVPMLAMTDSECKGKGIGLYTWETQASFDDVSILSKESARIDLDESNIITPIPLFSGNVLLPAGNMFDDTCDDFGKCRSNSGNLSVDNSMFIQATPIEDGNNPGKYIAWVEYEITPGSTIEFSTRNADKGIGIDPWVLKSSNDGIIWETEDCSTEISPDYIEDYWQIKTHFSSEIQSPYIRIYFPANVSNWKAGLDAVSAYSMEGKIELICEGNKVAETEIGNDGKFEIQIQSRNPLPLGHQSLEFVVKNLDDMIMARKYINTMVIEPLFYDDMESGNLNKWSLSEGNCSLSSEEDGNHKILLDGNDITTVAGANIPTINDFSFTAELQVLQGSRFSVQFGNEPDGFHFGYDGENIRLQSFNTAEGNTTPYVFEADKSYNLSIETTESAVSLLINSECILSLPGWEGNISQFKWSVENTTLTLDNVFIIPLYDAASALEDYRLNTNLTLDKNSITVSSESNNVATLNVNFPTRSTAQLPEDLSADMKIECLNKSFSPNTQIIIDLFWDDKYSTFTYRIDKECNYVWLSDILSINYGERPLLKELWRNLNTVKISYVLPDEATLNTDISVIAFDGQEIEIGNHVDLEIRVDQSSEINKVLTNRDLCYYCKESGMIVIKHKEFAPCQIYDLTGKLLHEVPSGQTTIDASSWAKGLYIVKAGNQIAKIAVN